MNRHAFLTGLLATSAIAMGPAIVETIMAAAPELDWETYFEKWMQDVIAIHVQCWEDMIIYGTSAWIETDTYPYIARIDPRELERPKTTGGLLNR